MSGIEFTEIRDHGKPHEFVVMRVVLEEGEISLPEMLVRAYKSKTTLTVLKSGFVLPIFTRNHDDIKPGEIFEILPNDTFICYRRGVPETRYSVTSPSA